MINVGRVLALAMTSFSSLMNSTGMPARFAASVILTEKKRSLTTARTVLLSCFCIGVILINCGKGTSDLTRNWMRKARRSFALREPATVTLKGVQTPIHVIGGGLAGTEAAWQIARRGIPVVLSEMRPARQTPAHQTDRLAELVCSNSLKSEQRDTAPWLLKEELRRLDSLLLQAAQRARVPGGQA